jgi:hypothetical protein
MANSIIPYNPGLGANSPASSSRRWVPPVDPGTVYAERPGKILTLSSFFYNIEIEFYGSVLEIVSKRTGALIKMFHEKSRSGGN